MKKYTTQLSRLFILLTVFHCYTTNARPFQMIDVRSPRHCITTAYPPSSKLEVTYEFLEFSMSEDSVEIIMKPTSYNDDDDTVMDDNYDDDDGSAGSKPGHRDKESEKTEIHQVPKKSGKVEFYLKHHGPRVEVCVHGNRLGRAVMSRPLFFNLYIHEETAYDDGKAFEDDYIYQLMSEKDMVDSMNEMKKIEKDKEKQHQHKGFSHMTAVEQAIMNMIKEVDYISNQAKWQQDLVEKFFKKNKQLHSSIKFWPSVHILVLFVTGFAQAKHMMNFFKSRRVM